MGNQLKSRRPDLPEVELDRPVLNSATLLTRWTKSQILQVYSKYTRHCGNSRFFLKRGQLNSFLMNTPGSSLELLIIELFLRDGRINILELLAGLITYSSLNWTTKVKLAVYVFDFDGNKIISKDEMVIMMHCFIKSIACMTGADFIQVREVEEIADEMFHIIDKDPDGKLTPDE